MTNLISEWAGRHANRLPKDGKLLYGTGMMAYAGSLNIPEGAQGNNIFFGTRGGFGLGTSVGIEYYPIPQISIGTESLLFFGFGTEILQIVPPIGITLNAHLR